MTSKLGKIVQKNGKSYKFVPPDGGYGYVIAVIMAVVIIAVMSPYPCYGILYGEFFKESNISVSGAGLQNGLSMLSFCVSAFASSSLMKRFSIRQVGLLGGILYSIGMFYSIIMTTLNEFVIATGIVAGIGAGILFNCSLTAFNSFFDKKKVFVMSACNAVISVVTIVIPLLINICMTELGWRGTMAILCGMGLQTIVAFSLVHPVEEHLKLEEIATESDNPELEALKPKGTENAGVEDSTVDGIAVITLNDVKPKTSAIKSIVKHLDLDMLKDGSFCNTCVGISCSTVADFFFVSLLPLYLADVHWSKADLSYILTLMAIGDTAGRVLMAMVSKFYSVNTRSAFVMGLAAAAFTRIVMFIPADVTVVLCVGTVYGFCRSFMLVLPPLILAEQVGAAKFAAAQGLQLLTMGLLTATVGPIIGVIKDWSGSYAITFCVLNCVPLPYLLSSAFEAVVFKTRVSKKVEQ